jgi:hypothetical protein
MDPAETPESTTPASHAARIAGRRSWTSQTARRFATDPPFTQTTSCSRRWDGTSSTLGIGNSMRTETSNPATRPASSARNANHSGSPEAVPTNVTRGRRPWTPERSTAWWTRAWNSTAVRVP